MVALRTASARSGGDWYDRLMPTPPRRTKDPAPASPAAALVQLARLETGLTQAALAERLGWRPETISAYERGKRDPSMATLLRILRAAGMDLRLHLEPYSPADGGEVGPAERAWRRAEVHT